MHPLLTISIYAEIDAIFCEIFAQSLALFFAEFSSNSAEVADHAADFSMKTASFRGEDVINNSRGAFGVWAVWVPCKTRAWFEYRYIRMETK